jgi:hypothetical protein
MTDRNDDVRAELRELCTLVGNLRIHLEVQGTNRINRT